MSPISFIPSPAIRLACAVAAFALAGSAAAAVTPELLKDINTRPQDSSTSPYIVMGSNIVFPGIDLAHGTELWKSDGTVSGDDENRVIRVEYIRRKDIGLNYVPKVSSTLDPASFVPMSGEEIVQAVDALRGRVIREQAAEPGVTRLFGVVEVGGPDPRDPLRDGR